jgi:hypothetical protein
VSLLLYILIGYNTPEHTPERLEISEKKNPDGDGAAPAAIPTPAGPADAVVPAKD